jgi:hypothetical protein
MCPLLVIMLQVQGPVLEGGSCRCAVSMCSQGFVTNAAQNACLPLSPHQPPMTSVSQYILRTCCRRTVEPLGVDRLHSNGVQHPVHMTSRSTEVGTTQQ